MHLHLARWIDRMFFSIISFCDRNELIQPVRIDDIVRNDEECITPRNESIEFDVFFLKSHALFYTIKFNCFLIECFFCVMRGGVKIKMYSIH